ncbi:hypothetical protein [Stenotrophomonas sepilia]
MALTRSQDPAIVGHPRSVGARVEADLGRRWYFLPAPTKVGDYRSRVRCNAAIVV